MKTDMKEETELMEQPEGVVLSGVTYEKKSLFFDQLVCENDYIRIHVCGEKPQDVYSYMFYDKGTEDGVWLYDVSFDGEWMAFNQREDVMAVYEAGIRRYTFLAVNKDDQSVYTFNYIKDTGTDKYDHMSSVLYTTELGKTEDDQKVDAVFYAAGEERILRLVVQKEYMLLKQFLDAKIKTVRMKGDVVRLHITLKDYGYRITRIYMRLRSKTEDIEYDFQFHTEKKKGKFDIQASIGLKELKLAQFYWDIKALAEKDGVIREIELKNKEKWMHRIMYVKQMRYVDEDNNIIYPYKTKSNNIALQFRPKTPQDCWTFIMKEHLALGIYYLLLPYLKKKKIWLVYEKYCVMAQDNGFYFFKYCMENLPESEKNRIYYVIDKKAPDYRYVKQYGNRVIHFLSLKHMVYLMAAQLLISSDTKAHAYAWHSPNSIYRNMLKRKENVFLQHGVIAFKCCHQGLRKKSVNASRLFVVSSEVEKQIILDFFGYDEEEILVTGLARWDVLEDKSHGQPRQIILMPTWRTWLEEVSEEEFIDSDYYKHYMSVLNNPVLLDTLEKYKITLNFYIHPKFREYMGAFQADSHYVRLIPFGAEPLNELMMKCSMMITDYSSAVWDVFYQGKPVAFYLFDLELYNEIQGSYINMETEAFGDVAHTPEALADLIQEYAKNDFREKELYRDMRQKQIAYIDDKNSERTYLEIIKRFPMK